MKNLSGLFAIVLFASVTACDNSSSGGGAAGTGGTTTATGTGGNGTGGTGTGGAATGGTGTGGTGTAGSSTGGTGGAATGGTGTGGTGTGGSGTGGTGAGGSGTGGTGTAGSSVGGATGGGPPCVGAAGAPNACAQCYNGKCPTQVATENTACADFLACEAGCGCSDTTCLTACATQHLTNNPACVSANDALKQCKDASCATECNTVGTPTTPNCVALAACCTTLPGGTGAQATCAQAAGYNNDGPCAGLLTQYQNAGQCKTSMLTYTSCDYSASTYLCQQYGLTNANLKPTYDMACTSNGGAVVAKCPTAGLIGCCTVAMGMSEICYYTGGSVDDAAAQMMCSQQQGKWSTTP
jgi:hypothetical protein